MTSKSRKKTHHKQDSFDRLHGTLYPTIFRTVLHIVKNASDAEDITQEVFIKIHNEISSGKHTHINSVPSWARRIAKNMAINAYHRRNRYTNKMDTLRESLKQETTLRSAYTNYDFTELMESLTTDQRICLFLFAVEGLTAAEISEKIGISVACVRSRIKRARESLRKKNRL